jgi:hypothetical protein
MAAPVPCVHCNGTTYCGAFKRKGVLMTQPACPTCLVKSGLHPKATYHKVICSVCEGTGVVQPGAKNRARTRSPTQQLLFYSPFVLGTIVLSIASIIAFFQKQEKEKTERDTYIKETFRVTTTMTWLEIKEQVQIGMSREVVLEVLGAPNFVKDLASGMGTLEVWQYNCKDGQVQISFQDGKVITVRVQ